MRRLSVAIVLILAQLKPLLHTFMRNLRRLRRQAMGVQREQCNAPLSPSTRASRAGEISKETISAACGELKKR